MSEEEKMKIAVEQKEAIEYLKKYTKWETYGERNLEKDIITTLNLVDKLQKENENLKSENSRLKVIRYSREYGTENIYLIPKSDLVQIDINKYMIEIEDGKFVDLKQIYQENKELQKENEKLNKLHIQDNKHLDFIMKHSVPVQKIKDKIEYLKDYIEENSDEQGYWGNINPDVIYGQIEILEEILRCYNCYKK